MSLKIYLKKIEQINRKTGYFIIRLFFRNHPADLPLDSSKIKKILILRYDAIGDFVLTTPCLDLLKKMIPDCEIHLLASHRNYELSQNHPSVDKTFVYNGSAKSLFNCIKEMRKEKYDLIFAGVFDRTTFAGVLSNLISRSAVKICIGHETRNEQYGTFFNIIILPAQRGSINMALLMQLILIDAFGWQSDAAIDKLSLGVDESMTAIVKNKIKAKQNKLVLYNISARNTWKKEKHLEFIALFKKQYQQFDIILSAIDSDRDIVAALIEKNDDVLYYKSDSVMELISLISIMDYVISPDTSIPHISAAMGIPVVDIYPLLGTTSIREWIPYGAKAVVVTTDGYQTIDFIIPQKVIDAFRQLIEQQIPEG